MHRRQTLALCGAALAFVVSPAAAALAASGPSVNVRVEGLKRTLLSPAVVHTATGSITKGGAPPGACSAISAAGALDAATHHHWSGTFEHSFGDYFIKTILGETQSGTKSYWGIWVNNRYATTGACGIKVHKRDRLLFAVDSVAHHEHPLALKAPASVRTGHSFKVKVVSFSDAGRAQPLAGARVSGAGVSVTTDKHGITRIPGRTAGTLVLHAGRQSYIRAASVKVRVVL
jgi:hypothetical protein